MEYLTLLLDVILIFISVKSAAGTYSPTEVYCLKHVQPIKLIGYNVELTPYINEDDYKNTTINKKFKSYIDEQRARGNFIFYGESTMSFKSIGKLRRICLHAVNLEIDQTATEIVFNNVTYVPRTHIYDQKSQVVELYFETGLRRNSYYTYRLNMKFVGSITDNTGGFVKTFYINSRGEKTWIIAAANFRGIAARQIFPCWDEPDLRTKFTISIKHHKNYTALSNSPINYVSTDKNGMVWTRFRKTDNISPYHVAVVLSDLDSISENVWCRDLVGPQTEFAQKVAENVTLYLKRLFHDGQFPPKVDHVVIPGFRDEGLESWGLVLYREEAVIYNKSLDTIAWKFEVARIVARKMVHQYFSNLVGQTWWNYLWLNEGIATLLSMKIVKEFINFHLMDLLAVQFQHESLRLNDYYDMPLIIEPVNSPSDINSLFSFTYYIKAPVFIRSLSQMVSEHTFLQGLNKYLTTYQFISDDIYITTTDIFFDALQKVELYKSDINLTMKMNEWTTRNRYPLLQMTRESSGDNVEITLQEYLDKSYPKDLYVRVTYTTQNALNITKEKWLTPQMPILHLTDIKKNDWIIVNVQQAGYYRVNYDKDNWKKLKEYLNSTEYINIHVLNRAQIIDDAYYFLLKNKLDFRFFKNLTHYLSRETNYVAWYPMLKIIEEISGFFLFPESTEVQEHFRTVLNFVLGKIGYSFIIGDMSKDDDFIKCLRQEAAKWACILNSRQCANVAIRELRMHKDRPILPGWKKWTYCNGLMSANDIFWNKVFKTEVLDNNLLEYLACTKNHTIIIGYLDLLKSGHFTEAQHRITVFHSIIARHARNDLVLHHIIDNFDNVVPREIETIVALIDIINHVYSRIQIVKVLYYAQKTLITKGFKYVIGKANIRLSEINKHVDYFKKFLITE